MHLSKLPEGPDGDGWYYLHTNGSLIWKRFRPEDDSDFVRAIWPVKCTSRAHAWFICVEALALGASKDRIDELAAKWELTDRDAQEFVKHTDQFLLSRDGNKWCATFKDFVNLQESQSGFGDTALEALAELAKPGLCERAGRPLLEE